MIRGEQLEIRFDSGLDWYRLPVPIVLLDKIDFLHLSYPSSPGLDNIKNDVDGYLTLLRLSVFSCIPPSAYQS